MSDLHITDTESPARLDFMIDVADDPRREQALPTPRPQQLLSTHAAAATMRTVGRMAAGGRLDFAVLTGDLIDNGQRNELDRLLATITGGRILPTRAPGVVEGTQTPAWSDSKVWRPAGAADHWSAEYGFPPDAGLLAAVSEPFSTSGLSLPVLLARGNHDALFAGFVRWTPELTRLATGAEKVRGLPAAESLTDPQKRFLTEPDSFFTGARTPVAPDERRRPLEPGEFPLALNAQPDRVQGHDYIVQIGDRVVIVVLDTVDENGHPDGVLSSAQAAWLDDTLTAIETDLDRPIVIVASHHGPSHHHVTTPTPRRLTGTDAVDLLGRHPSVAIWLNGHTHAASVTRHRATDRRGFWEITADSIIDWPCRFQTVEVLENPSGALTILVTKTDYDTEPAEDEATGPARLAALHRLITANQAGFGDIFPGAGNHDVHDYVLRLEAAG
ncbi:metallophosphoesterase [Spirillospora sp. CA-255316]